MNKKKKVKNRKVKNRKVKKKSKMQMKLIKKGSIFVALALILVLAALLVSSPASAQLLPLEVPLHVSYETPFNYYGEAAQYYFPSFTQGMCESGQDFIIEIPPGACTPAVVRTDLLEEQPVPVFCKLTGIKLNPIIEVPHIRRIRVAQMESHKDIATVLFHPARVGLQTSFARLIGSPTLNDWGYLVVVLRRNEKAEKMPDIIEVNLTAKVEYEIEKTFGIAENQILLPILTDQEWKNSYEKYGFWNGRGYVRAKDIKENKAKIEVYDGGLRHLHTFNLEEGTTSKPSFMPGFYCSAGYKVRLEDIEYPALRAELYVNDDKLIVTKGMTLGDSGCVVERIKVADYGLGGSVKIRCLEGSYTLTKEGTTKAKLSINGSDAATVNIGDSIYNNIRLVYAGKVMREGDEPLKVIVVADVSEKISGVIKELWKDANGFFKKEYWEKREEIHKKEGEVAKEISKYLVGYLDKGAGERIKEFLGYTTQKWVIVNSGKIDTTEIEIEEIGGLQKIKYDDTIEGYYKEAIDAYHDVAEDYPYLVDKSGDAYGAKALLKAADKAKKLDKTFDQAVFLEKLIKDYPNSGFAAEAREELAGLYSIADIGKASRFISSEGRDYSIELIEIIEPTKEEMNVELSIDNGATKVFTEHDLIARGEWQISEIRDNRIHFKSLNTSEIRKIYEDEEDWLGKTKVKVVEITLKKFARVSVLPWSKEGVTYANFTFRIGIEKRAIKLSPEQTKDYIKKIDKAISKWENINTKLGKVVTTWKKTCLIGGSILVAKNILESLSGKGIARKMVISGDKELGIDGWKSKCEGLMAENKEKYSSLSDCYLQHNNIIESEVELMRKAIKTTNENNKKAKEGNMREGKALFLGFYTPKTLDKEGYIQKYGGIIGEQYKDIEGVAAVAANFSTLYERRDIYPSDVRDLATLLELKKQCEGKTGGICEEIVKAVNRKLDHYGDISIEGVEKESLVDAVKNSGLLDVNTIKTVGAKGKKLQLPIHKFTYGQLENIDKDKRVEMPYPHEKLTVAFFTAEFTGITYLAALDHRGETHYDIENLYELEEIEIEEEGEKKNKIRVVKKLSQEEKTSILEKIEVSYIEGIEPDACVSVYKKREIRFWESGPYKGLPALMPIDTKRGWYAATKAYGSGLEAYQESGKISNFWICNVGKNGEPDFDFSFGPEGDDAVCCAEIPFAETYKGQIFSLDGPQTDALVKRAIKCMKEAAREYKAGKKRIATECCPDCVMGKPAVSAPSTTCENFMSPADCNLMFNLCDPVVCPNSRCNFGGRMPVDDVIQTGIIGGLTLCLPNAKEVAVPICLSGVHAGLDNFITILKSTKACLEESLRTGKNIGICDQLKSVYICEFFWRQLTPFLKVGIPSLVEGLFGGRKSGGEYLAFSNAWKGAGDSVKYFMDYYDDEAFRAFTTRSMAEAGSQVCKAFVSLSYPDQIDLWDELTEPESPYQVNAVFHETPMTTATVPAMSQYKVYYHIYSGKDKGHYYMVYLRQPPKPGYYETPEIYPVPEAVGYMEAGQFVDVAKDFTAPANYIELCVRIDAKDHCGFGKATTTFAVNELMDSYLSEQAAMEIATEKECISGIPGMIAPNLNPQALVEETIEPALWRRGIVRICSSENPGEGVEPERWDAIGYCDSKDVKCWLDKESVKSAIKDIGLQEKVLDDAREILPELLEKGFINKDDAEAKFAVIEKEKPAVLASLEGLTEKKEINRKLADIIGRLSNLVEGSLAEDVRAKSQLQIGAIYNYVVTLLTKEPAEIGEEEEEEEEEEKEEEETEEEEVEEKEEKEEEEMEEEKKEEEEEEVKFDPKLAYMAHRDFTILTERVMGSKESECYTPINLDEENLGEYKIRIRRSLIKDKELCLKVFLFKVTKRRFDVLNLFPKEEVIKESLACTEKEGIVEADTGFFALEGAIQEAGMVLEIKEGKLVATPDIYRAKGIGKPVLFKTESKISWEEYPRKVIIGFMQEGTKEITNECE